MPVFGIPPSSDPGLVQRPVSALVDRMLREFLETPEEQPTRFVLAADISADATELTYKAEYLTPEEEDILGPGTLIEIGSEQLLVGTVAPNAKTVSGLHRRANGTDASAHNAGSVIKVLPTWTRLSVFEAIADAIVGLYPSLYTVDTVAIAPGVNTATEVAAEVAFPMFAWGSTGEGPYDVTFLDSYPGVASGKAILVPDLAGSTGYLVFGRRFSRPVSELDDLDDIGVSDEWDRLILVSAMTYLLAGREIDAVTQEFLTQQLERQNFPVGSATRVRDGLVKYYEYLLSKARRDLRNRYPARVTRSW